MSKEEFKRLMDKTEKLQEEMHQIIEMIMQTSPEVSYQDAVNVFMLMKLAQLSEKIY